MTPRFLLAAIALSGALAGPSVAAAQSLAYAIPYGTTNMRAGPGIDYPVVAIIRGGSAITVYGCLSDFSWCDSSVEDIRGWVSTTRMQFEYGGNLVPVPSYYSYFDAPIIGFDFGYWDRYYSDRPFYRDRHRDRRHRRDWRPRDDASPGGTRGGPAPDDQYQPYDQRRTGNLNRYNPSGNYDQYQGSDSVGPGAAPPRQGGDAPPPSTGMDDSGPARGGGGVAGGQACPPQSPDCQ